MINDRTLAERHPFPDYILPYGWRVASLGQWYSKENCAISSVWLYATFYVVDSEISSEQSFKKGCMTLCPFFIFLKKEDHALLPVSFPCCEPTTFYTIYYPFHFLAASLRRFKAVQCEHSEAHEREKRKRNPCRDPIRLKKVHGFYTVFSLFHTENCGLFSVYPTFFFPPRQERTR
jgi:hypothetical protein